MQGEQRMGSLLVFPFGQQGFRDGKQQQHQQFTISQPLSVSLSRAKQEKSLYLTFPMHLELGDFKPQTRAATHTLLMGTAFS